MRITGDIVMQTIKTFVCRPYKVADLEPILSLFHNTVHSINIKDYSQEQVNVRSYRNYHGKQHFSKIIF